MCTVCPKILLKSGYEIGLVHVFIEVKNFKKNQKKFGIVIYFLYICIKLLIMNNKKEIFTLVFNEKWNVEWFDKKYIIISEPKAVEDGYIYNIKEYKNTK